MADNYSVKDGTGTTLIKGSTDLGGGVHADKVRHVDASGNLTPAGDATARPIFTKITNGTLDLGIYAEDAAHSSGHVGLMALGVRNATATDLSAGNTDGDYEPFQVDASGRVHVNVGIVTPGTAASSLGKAEDGAHTSGDVGVMALSVRSDTAAAGSGTDGDYAALLTDAAGRLHVAPGVTAVNGASFHNTNGLANTAVAVKASAGTLYSVVITNSHSAVQYVQVWNTAQGSVTVGTTAPVMVFAVPATSSVALSFGLGMHFSTAITVAATTGPANATTATASTIYFAAAYK